MGKKEPSLEKIKKTAIGLLDSRQTDNDGLLIKRDRSITMVDVFGSEQKAAVAYYVSNLLAKGFNDQQIIEIVKKEYGLEWNLRSVKVVKELLRKMWRCDIAHTMNDQIAQEVATINVQLKELWEAWEFSKKGIEHKKVHTGHQDSPSDEMSFDINEIYTDTDTTPGDIKYMQQINELGKEKRKLLGLYAPEKKNVGISGGGTNNGTVNIVVVGGDGNPLGGAVLGDMEQKKPVEDAKAEVVDERGDDFNNLIDTLM